MVRGIGNTKIKKKKTGLMEDVDYGNETHQQVWTAFGGLIRKKKNYKKEKKKHND